jgi:hypothetical protein
MENIYDFFIYLYVFIHVVLDFIMMHTVVIVCFMRLGYNREVGLLNIKERGVDSLRFD